MNIWETCFQRFEILKKFQVSYESVELHFLVSALIGHIRQFQVSYWEHWIALPRQCTNWTYNPICRSHSLRSKVEYFTTAVLFKKHVTFLEVKCASGDSIMSKFSKTMLWNRLLQIGIDAADKNICVGIKKWQSLY